jgi:site-specific DNA recombinase
MLLRNQLYAGIVDVPKYGVRSKRGDFEPLISEDLFYRVQAVLSGRVPSTTPQQRAHPDFPLRAFVRCETCGRGLTGSWSKGRSEYYAYYHCRPGCRAVNVTKAKLEGLFADELAQLQPTPGYMRLLKESVLQIWKARKAAVREEIVGAVTAPAFSYLRTNEDANERMVAQVFPRWNRLTSWLRQLECHWTAA